MATTEQTRSGSRPTSARPGFNSESCMVNSLCRVACACPVAISPSTRRFSLLLRAGFNAAENHFEVLPAEQSVSVCRVPADRNLSGFRPLPKGFCATPTTRAAAIVRYSFTLAISQITRERTPLRNPTKVSKSGMVV